MNVVRSDAARDVLLVEGDDAGQFLHSQLANDIVSVPVGGSLHSLLLEPTGHVHSLLRVVRHGDTRYTLDVEAGFGPEVLVRLRRFVLRARLAMDAVDWMVRSFRGTGVGGGVDGMLSGRTGAAVVAWGDEAERHVALDVIGERGDLPDVGSAVDPAEVAAFDTDLRWPRMGTDLLAGDVPATSGILQAAVSFTKGCYPGQELVERMDSRGTSAPVELRALPRDGRNPGDPIVVDGERVGVVTSVGRDTALVRVARGSGVGEPLR